MRLFLLKKYLHIISMSNNINVSVNGQSPNITDFQNQLPPRNHTEFDHHLDVENIKLMVYQLLSETNCNEDNSKRSKKQFPALRGKYQKKYEPLMMRYPALFNMIIENGENFDLIQFEQMMSMISKVRTNKISEENASKQFGQQMVDKFVKPNLK